ncbi:hypothetical protein H2201_006548 [Coniosporium apollinis]|uniref:Arrestin-like N-terminal domain-containing protein n=1 Tax=Coniosporium apollinis TaxID=61459 RepID=A0ABQ9NLK2_9PEZI|nr:hypothetical protein H2201_006548 [Coniosporium apollinis]
MVNGDPDGRIILDEPNRVYTAGDIVRGHVLLEVGRRQESCIVAVTIYSRTKTRLHTNESAETHRGRCLLFAESQILRTPENGIPAGRHTLPFSLIFPSETSASQTLDKTYTSSAEAGEPLPPTFDYEYVGFWTKFECFVAYSIEVRITTPYDKDGPLTAEVPLTFAPVVRGTQPQNPEPHTTTHALEVKTLRLLPENAARKLSITAKAKSVLKTSSIPTSCFDLVVQQPRTAYLNAPLAFTLRLKHDLDRLTAPPRRPFADYDDYAEDVVWEAFSFDAELAALGAFSKAEDWSKIVLLRLPEKGVSLSFKTYNIKRSYKLKVRAVVVAVEKELEVKSSLPVVVKGEWRRRVEEVPEGAGRVEGGEGEAPPPYREATSAW